MKKNDKELVNDFIKKRKEEQILEETQEQIIHELNRTADDSFLDYDENSYAILGNDIIKIEKIISKNKWYWHIPFIGYDFYALSFSKDINEFESSIAKSEYSFQHTHFFAMIILMNIVGMIFPYAIIKFHRMILREVLNSIEAKKKK